MKKIIIASFAAMCSLFATAQISHEFLAHVGCGMSTINYKLSSGKKTPGFDGEFGVGYICHFGEMAGIYAGIDFSFYHSGATLDGTQVVTENLTDNEGDRFHLYTTLNTYKERQKVTFLNIPVMALFQTKQTHKFYAMGGVKIGIPLSCLYEAKDATITNEAYYPAYDNWLREQEFAGYGRFEYVESAGRQKYTVSAALALETGMKWKLGKMVALYTGIYFDCGLNNIAKKSDRSFVNYTPYNPAAFTVNSALVSAADKINVIAVGVKVRLALIK